jgi:hypothetical protein
MESLALEVMGSRLGLPTKGVEFRAQGSGFRVQDLGI